MAGPDTELDPLAPKHPGVTFWDFVDARGLDPNDSVVPAAHRQALEQYKCDLAAYRAAKTGRRLTLPLRTWTTLSSCGRRVL